MLALQELTQTNDSELRRKNCCYPLRFQQEGAFKREPGSGQGRG
jgi:hypothetical protein